MACFMNYWQMQERAIRESTEILKALAEINQVDGLLKDGHFDTCKKILNRELEKALAFGDKDKLEKIERKRIKELYKDVKNLEVY